MARKHQRAKYPDRWYDIHLRLTGKQKNEILAYADKKGISVNELILYAVWDHIRSQKGIPSPGESPYRLPTVDEVLAAYIAGEKVMQPCGKFECEQKLTQLDSMTFCETCNLRVR